MKKVLLFTVCSFIALVFVTACNKSGGSSPRKKESYTVEISPKPSIMKYGAYGTLTATVTNDITGEIVENPEVVWSISKEGMGTFEPNNANKTVFKAREGSDYSIFGCLIFASYKGFESTISPGIGNANITIENPSAVIWIPGNNDIDRFSIIITSPAANEFFILKGESVQLCAVVKRGNGIDTENAVVDWSIPAGMGSFSSNTADTVFTAGNMNYRGQIIAKCSDGATAVKNIIIGEPDKIIFNPANTNFRLVRNGRKHNVKTVVSANGYILNPQPVINWKSSKPSDVTIEQSPSGGVDIGAIALSGSIHDSVTVTASVAGTNASAAITVLGVLDVATFYDDSIDISGITFRMGGTVPIKRIERLTAGGNPGNCIKVTYDANAAGSLFMWPMSIKLNAAYSKVKVSLKGGKGGERVKVHYANYTNFAKEVTLTTSWQQVEVNVYDFTSNAPTGFEYVFLVQALDNSTSETIIYLDNVYFN